MAYPQPPRKSRAPIVIVSLVAVVALCCGAGGIAYLVSSNDRPSTAAGPSSAPPILPREAFDTYWSQWEGTSWGAAVRSVDVEGATVVAATTLAPGAEAQGAAMTICGAVTTFYTRAGDDVPLVQVRAGDGQVLASWDVLGKACAWRLN